MKLQKMPVLFLGHGSPMNAVENNSFTRELSCMGSSLPRPRAILCISAHWMTRGTWVTHMNHPRTIHDFYGFPKELFDFQYPAFGSPELADQVKAMVKNPSIGCDDSEWGLDHGTWSVLRHLYPEADIPVVQLSLNISMPGEFHLELGKKLKYLREQGVLILGSGNIVHNLRQIQWNALKPFAWAEEFDEWVKQKSEKRDFKALASDYSTMESGRLSVPTPDHYFPLLYVLGAVDSSDELQFDVTGLEHGSLSMRSLRFS